MTTTEQRFPLEFRHLPDAAAVVVHLEVEHGDFGKTADKGFPMLREFLSKHELAELIRMYDGTSVYFYPDEPKKTPFFAQPGYLIRDGADLGKIQTVLNSSENPSSQDTAQGGRRLYQLQELKEGEWAVFTVKGSYSQLKEAWETAFPRLAALGRHVDTTRGLCYDFYHKCHSATPEQELVTEVRIPVVTSKAASSS